MNLIALLRGARAAIRAPRWLAGPSLISLTEAAPAPVPGAGVDPESLRAARRTLRLLARIPGGGWRSTCLYRSVAEVLLRREAGEDARLRLGARRQGEAIGAHAWVESAGVPVGTDATNARHFAALR